MTASNTSDPSNAQSTASIGTQNEKSPELINGLDIKLSAIPVGDRAVPAAALRLYTHVQSSPTYFLPLADGEFVVAYMQLLELHLQAVSTMYNDFMNGTLGDATNYSQ